MLYSCIIGNAVVHRDYSIKGTDIQIKMFDDRLVVESPGKLPGLVRLHNMREIHFSRNPKIATILKDFKFVKELGEGVDRMFREMQEHGLPEPEYSEKGFMTVLAARNGREEEITSNHTAENKPSIGVLNGVLNGVLTDVQIIIINFIKEKPKATIAEITESLDMKRRTVERSMKELRDKGFIERKGSKKLGFWEVRKYLGE